MVLLDSQVCFYPVEPPYKYNLILISFGAFMHRILSNMAILLYLLYCIIEIDLLLDTQVCCYPVEPPYKYNPE